MKLCFLYPRVDSQDGHSKRRRYRRFYVVLPLQRAAEVLRSDPRNAEQRAKLHAAGLLVGGLCEKKALQGL